ncbi:MAG: ABC-2 family transporter protein [Deltaproteobacteria bacterium]|nr:ABC-2 family transporter protein [Deltaproteobacteria bacterium]
MIKNIRHYFSIYQSFIVTCFAESMNFRMHFLLLIIMDLFFYVSALASVYILYEHVPLIGSWNREQFLFFISIMLAVNQLTMTFVSESFWQFPLLIRTGNLDFILLKPANAIFSTFFRYVRPGSMVNVIFTWSATIYFGIQLDLNWFSWMILPFLVFMGFFLQNSIELVISCSMFWMLEGTGINFLRIELQQLSRWPDFIYQSFVRRILTLILPILLIGSAPARFLFDFNDIYPLLGMGLAIIFFWIILKFTWAAGLKAYESASS